MNNSNLNFNSVETLAESLVMRCVIAVDWGAIVSWQKCV